MFWRGIINTASNALIQCLALESQACTGHIYTFCVVLGSLCIKLVVSTYCICIHAFNMRYLHFSPFENVSTSRIFNLLSRSGGSVITPPIYDVSPTQLRFRKAKIMSDLARTHIHKIFDRPAKRYIKINVFSYKYSLVFAPA